MKFNLHKLEFENISSSIKSWYNKRTQNDYLAVGVIILISFLNFGRILSTYVFNNDGVSRINVPFYKFFDYTEKGRWGYALIYHLFNTENFTPFLNVITVIGILIVLIILIWKVFEITELLPRIVSGSMFISFPILIHYFFYTGDAEVYSTGMLLMVLSLYVFRKNNHKIKVAVLLLNTLALGVYPASFSFLTTLFFGYSLMSYYKNKDLKIAFNLLWKGIVISVLSLGIYFLITKLLISYFELELTNYKNASSISVTGLLEQLPSKLIASFQLFGDIFIRFKPVERLFLMILSLGFFVYLIPKNSPWYLKVLTPVIWLGILILSVFTTYMITYDSHLYVGFIFGFLLFLVFLTKVIFDNIHGIAKTFAILMFAFLIIKNIQNNNIITHTHEQNVEASKLIANNVLLDIQKLPNYNMKETPVVFLGYIGNNLHYNFKPPYKRVRVLNNMYVPVGFKENRSFKLASIFYILYHDVNVVYENEEWELTHQQRFSNITTYPEEGSVFVQSDTVFVKLGDYSLNANH